MLNAPLVSPSRLRLWLCVSLPLALGWWLPRSYGASIEAFPVILGLLLAGVAGTVGLGSVSRAALVWLSVVFGALLLRGSTLSLYNLMLLPLALAAWIGFSLGNAAFREERVARAVGLGLAVGMAVNLASGSLQYLQLDSFFHPWVTEGGLSERIYGNTRQPNHFAVLMALSMALLWWLAVRRALSLMILLLLMGLSCLGIALSGSRIGVAAVFFVALLALVWRHSIPPRALAVFLAAPVLVLLLSLGLSLIAQFSDLKAVSVVKRGNETISMRTFHWKATLEMIKAEPMLGAGWREYRYARFERRPEDAATEVVEHAHNIFLHLAAELGVPLMLAITVPVFMFVVRRKPWREQDPTVQAGWMVLFIILLYSMVEFPLWVMNFLFLACIASGIVLKGGSQGLLVPTDGERNDELRRKGLQIGAAWVMVMAMLAALVDYDRASASSVTSTLFNWGRSEAERVSESHKSLLFGIYAERALIRSGKVLVNDQTYQPLLEITGRLMHFGPTPQTLSGRLMAYCHKRDYEHLDATIKVYRLAFPQAFDEFGVNLPPETARRCRVI